MQSVGYMNAADGMEVDGESNQAKRQIYVGQDGVNYKRDHREVGDVSGIHRNMTIWAERGARCDHASWSSLDAPDLASYRPDRLCISVNMSFSAGKWYLGTGLTIHVLRACRSFLRLARTG